jgi:hypothetical protein
VYRVIVFLSIILPMLLLSSKLKRNLIIAQNSTWYQSYAEESTFHWISKNVIVIVQEIRDFYWKEIFA